MNKTLFHTLLVLQLLISGLQVTCAQSPGTIPTTEFEAAGWMKSFRNTVVQDDDGYVSQLTMDYVPDFFVIGDLDIFEKLEVLHINVTEQFTDADMSGVARLHNLKEFKFVSCDEITTATLSVLQLLPKLEKLTISNCGGIDSIAALQNCSQLKSLDLSDNMSLDFSDLQYLAALPALEEINLSDNPYLSDAQLAELSKWPNLRRLVINQCSSISDAAILEIAKTKKLEELSAQFCKRIDGRFIKEIVSCPVKKLDLSNTSLTDERIIDLGQLRNLETLSLSGLRGVTSKGLEVLKKLTGLKQLSLEQLPVTDETLGWIGSQQLEVLQLTNCYRVTVVGLLQVESAATIKQLSLEGMRERSPDFAALAIAYPNLEILDLKNTRIRPDAFQSISSFKKLKRFVINDCRFLDDHAILEVAKLQTLEYLDAERIWKLSDAGLQSLAGIGSLKELRIGGSRKVTGEGLHEFKRCKNLETLKLSGLPGLTAAGIRDLHDIHSLKSLSIEGSPLDNSRFAELFGLQVESLRVHGSYDDVDDDLFENVMDSIGIANH